MEYLILTCPVPTVNYDRAVSVQTLILVFQIFPHYLFFILEDTKLSVSTFSNLLLFTEFQSKK